MKKNPFSIIAVIFGLLLAQACQKEKIENAMLATNSEAISKIKNEYRLSTVTGGGIQYTYSYNESGLCSEMNFADIGTFKQEYSNEGQLKISRWYLGQELLVTIHFFYDNFGRAIHEIWYTGDTDAIYDEAFYTRNPQGLITKMESYIGDYYTINQYTPEGNTKEWHYYVGGELAASGYLAYQSPHKNHFSAIPGVEYAFPFINASYYQNKNYPLGEKQVVYQLDGTPIVLFDYDPAKTIVKPGFRNYPMGSDYYNLETGNWEQYEITYENCRNKITDQLTTAPSTFTANTNTRMMLQQLFRKVPSSNAREQMRRQRIELLRMLQNK
jgi:YD repeat-containing protein